MISNHEEMEKLMEIPINAKVFCDEEVCGRSTFIVLDPVKEEVTHFVVEETTLPNIERLVPIELIEKSSHLRIFLCSSVSNLAFCGIAKWCDHHQNRACAA